MTIIIIRHVHGIVYKPQAWHYNEINIIILYNASAKVAYIHFLYGSG